jgi:hypothetical protein
MKIENSNNIIRIRFDGFLSCLYIKKPRAVDWPDHRGSVGRYYACLPFNEWDQELQKEIENRISSVKSIEDLKNSTFLELLETGEYEFELWNNKETSLLYNTNLFNSNETIYKWHKERVGQHRVQEPFSLYGFYPYGRQLMFTQPFESLNPQRVKHYEEIIKNGERPLAISIRVKRGIQEDEDSYQNTDENTTKYILDGHHKLVAYQNLKINPSYIVINRILRQNSNEPDESSLPLMKPYLFHYQIENIISNGLNSINKSSKLAEFIDDYLQNCPRINDTLVRTLHRNSEDSNYQKDELKRIWFKERLNKFTERLNKNKSEFFLEYYCSKDFRTKNTRVDNFEEIKTIMKEQL